MTVEDNLERQYNDISGFIEEYVAFVERIVGRTRVRYSFLFGTWRRLLIDPLKLPGDLRRRLPELATDEEKRNPFFAVVASDDVADALSTALIARFPGVDFGKVKSLHDLKEPKVASFNVMNVVGVGMAVMGGFLQSLQSSATHEPVQRTPLVRLTFWTTVLTLVYALTILFPRWIRHVREKETHNFANYLLGYTWIRTRRD